jgi:hypothetical protein
MRLIEGLSLFSISSTFFDVIPASSASIIAILGPAHDVLELVVAVAHDRSQRLLGDDLRQDDEVVGLGAGVGARVAYEARGVGRVDVAAAGRRRLRTLVDLFDQHRLEGHLRPSSS